MGFNVEFRDKEDRVVEWNQLDKEVCDLWGVAQDADKWATPPEKEYRNNWHEFLGRSVMLTRSFKKTATYSPSDLLQGLCLFGGLYPQLDTIEKYKYELQLLFFWIRQEYQIIVTIRW